MQRQFAPVRFGFLLFVSFVFSALIMSGCKDKPDYPEYRGERGESCESRNDCRKGLACVSNTCVVNEYPFSATASECVTIECTESADCCDEKPDFLDLNCSKDRDALLQEWNTCRDALAQAWDDYYSGESPSGPTWDCNKEMERFQNFSPQLFEKYCECNKTCEDSRCEDTPEEELPTEECEVPAEGEWDSCGFGRVCHDGECVECASDVECQERNLFGDPASWYCSPQNTCKQTCYNDSNCGRYQACDDGTCVETDGCTSDRECAFNNSDVTSVCNKATGRCSTECSTNIDCSPRGTTDGDWNEYACEGGFCVFVGCENDQECQARSNYSPTQRHTERVCRPIDSK